VTPELVILVDSICGPVVLGTMPAMYANDELFQELAETLEAPILVLPNAHPVPHSVLASLTRGAG
jgi:hypothetical protein